MNRPSQQPANDHHRTLIALLSSILIVSFGQLAYSQQNWADTPIYTNSEPISTTLNAPNNSPFGRPIEVASNPAATEIVTAEETVTDITDPEEVANALEEKTSKAIEEAKGTFSRAIKGDRQAQIDIATKYLLPIAVILLVMFLASRVGNYARDLVTRIVSLQVDETLGRFAGTLAKTAIMAIALMSVLGYYGVETTSLAALVAALGFAVGMALQGTLGNFAAGIALLVFRPFNVGDYIVVADEEGTVCDIALFTTTINTLDNRHIIIPNDAVFGSKIENWSHNEARRVDVLVGVSYSADMKQTRQVLTNAMNDIAGTIEGRSAQVYLCELNASSVDWSCRVWCRPSDYLAVKERVTEAAKTALDEHGIGIPFPQLDLHVVSAATQQGKMAA